MKEHKSWRTRLDEAKKRGKFTDDDRFKMCAWPTCFVGERLQLTGIGDLVNHPKFIPAYDLGNQAYRAVKTGNIKKAEEIYNQIQKLPKSEGEA